jgi:hypothetical protein
MYGWQKKVFLGRSRMPSKASPKSFNLFNHAKLTGSYTTTRGQRELRAAAPPIPAVAYTTTSLAQLGFRVHVSEPCGIIR